MMCRISKYIKLSGRKIKKDGLTDFFRTGWNTLFVNNIVYRHVKNNLEDNYGSRLINRENLKKDPDQYGLEYLDEKDTSELIRYGKIENGDIGDYEYINAGRRFVCKLHNISVIGPSGLGLCANGNIISETVGTPNLTRSNVSRSIAHSISRNGIWWTYNRFKCDSRNKFSSETPNFKEACLLIPLFNNYYHWTIESLLKIRGIEAYVEETGNTPTFLIPEDMTSWMYEALSLTGVDPDKDCVQWNERESYVSKLVIPSYPEPTPAECRWLKGRMYDSVGINPDETTSEERIYISREDATRRRVRNEDELMDTLLQYGFERYLLSELSVAEQVELFSKAEIVLSPHGAGLTNIVYAPDDVTVIELFGDRKKNTFYRIAEMLGYEYRYIDCDHDSVDIIVDVDRIEREVQSLVDNQ